MFTFQQVEAMREHRYGPDSRDQSPKRSRAGGGPSLYELLMALARGLAGVGSRDRDGKVHPASPAY